jgi:hypothetical protein
MSILLLAGKQGVVWKTTIGSRSGVRHFTISSTSIPSGSPPISQNAVKKSGNASSLNVIGRDTWLISSVTFWARQYDSMQTQTSIVTAHRVGLDSMPLQHLASTKEDFWSFLALAMLSPLTPPTYSSSEEQVSSMMQPLGSVRGGWLSLSFLIGMSLARSAFLGLRTLQ